MRIEESQELILTFFFVYVIIYMKIEGDIKMNEEKWKPIEEYGGKYEVSNYGRVKSYHKKKPRILLINYSTLCCWLNGTSPMPEEWKKKGLGYYGK